jgi:serine/threonine protein kinase
MLKAGDRIDGKYRLTRQIGAGAMGVVWAALHELTAREIAIKLVLRPTDELRRRLLKEARVCGGLSHRNIIEVLDVGQTDTGDPYLVMPLLYGETLADRLERQRRLDPKAAAQVARDIARALAAAHAAGVVHRDLKPANIFLQKEADGEAPTVKVLDFGVSKVAAAHDTLLASAAVAGGGVGSPAYMSPEQMRMDTSVDHRSDLWSLGVILFESLTGVRPFQGETQEVMRKVQSGDIPSVSGLVRFVDQGLADLVSRCLTRDRDRRIASAAELAAALQPFTGDPRRDSGEPPLRVSSTSLSAPAPAPAPSSPAYAQPEESGATDEATLQYQPGQAVNGAARRWATTLPITPSSPPIAPAQLPISDAVRASLEAKGAFGTFIMNPDSSRSTAPPGSSSPSSSPALTAARGPRRAGLSLGAAVGLVVGGSALLTALVAFFLLSRASPSPEPPLASSAAPESTSLSAQPSPPPLPAPPQSSALTSPSASAAPPSSGAPAMSAEPAPSQAAAPVAPAASPAPAATSPAPPAAPAPPKPTLAAPTPSPKSSYPAATPAKSTKPYAPKAPRDEIFRGPIFQ